MLTVDGSRDPDDDGDDDDTNDNAIDSNNDNKDLPALQREFKKEARTAYKSIKDFLDDGCKDGAKSYDVNKIARSVCILQARGRGSMDQLAYADNFFSLVSDSNMVVHEGSYFRCKLFKSIEHDLNFVAF